MFIRIKNTTITFLLALVNGVNLRPSASSDQMDYKPSTSGHGFICPTGNGSSQPGFTYDKKGRYYSISYHNVCPNPVMKDWNCNADYKQCKNGTTYHCAKDSITGRFTDACASPVFCGRGKKPIIQYPEGIAKIDCQYCEEDHFNDANKSSDTYTGCVEKSKCRYEEIECVTEGDARYWTQRRCRCNWRMNFRPMNLNTLRQLETPDKFCLEDVKCTSFKCNSSHDKRQELLPDYNCAQVCDPDYHRINETGKCVFKESNITNEVTPTAVVLSDPTTTQKNLSAQKVLSSTVSTGITTSKSNNGSITSPTTTKPDYSMNATDVVIGVVIGVVIVAVGVLGVWCCIHKSGKTTDERQTKSDNNHITKHNTNPPGTPECVGYTINSIELRWSEPDEADDNETQFFIGTYVIEKKEVGYQDWERVKTISCNSCTITGLKRETLYQFRVATFHNDKTGTFSHCSDQIRTQQPAIAPEICTNLKDIEAVKGNRIPISIRFRGKPVREVIWKKDGVVLEDIQDRLIFETNDVSEVCTMEVNSAERNDSGNYKLILRNESGQCERPFQIIVKDVPGKPGGPLSVKCIPESDKNEYQLAWKPPEDNGGSEIYNYIVEEKIDTGEWQTYISYVRDTSCIFCLDRLRKTYNFRVMAKNEQGISEACEMEIPLVLIAPKVNKVKDYVAVEGDQCIIPIPYDGVPQPDVYWTKNGLQGEEEHWRVYHKNDHETISLELNPTVKNDAGKYWVKLTNLLGHDEISFNIQIKYKPGKPEGPLEVKQIMSKIYLLEWRPPRDTGGSEIKKYIVEKRSSTGRWVFEYATTGCTFYIKDVRNYLYFRVKAENELGIGDSLEMDKPFVPVFGSSVRETADRTYVNRRYSAPDKTQFTGRLMSEKTEHYGDICVSGKEAGTLPHPASVFSVAKKPFLKDNLAQPCNGKDKEDAKDVSITMGNTRFSGNISGSFELENEEETLSYKQKKRFRLPSSGMLRQESGGGNCPDSSVGMLEILNEYKQDQDDDETFKSLKK